MRRILGLGLFFMLLAAGPTGALAEVVRCTLQDRTSDLVPEWVEYELDPRGTTVDVRDSVGARYGIGWVRGEVKSNTSKRLTITWQIGPLPRQDDWWTSAMLLMRLTRLSDGSVTFISQSPRAKKAETTYQGRGSCR